jgi:hypothetical protein
LCDAEPRLHLELSDDPDYHRGVTVAHDSGSPNFFEGFRPIPMAVCAIGGCVFIASFFIQGVHGLGRATGLFGIAVVLCGVTANLLMEAASVKADLHHRRHLMVQAAITSLLAIAICVLAVYLCRHGHLPGFMPGRYDEDHVKRLT